MKLLIIEDSEQKYANIEKELKKRRFREYKRATSLEEAEKNLKNNDIKAVIVDDEFPTQKDRTKLNPNDNTNGLYIIKKIGDLLKKRELTDCKVLIYSSDFPEIPKEYLEQGYILELQVTECYMLELGIKEILDSIN